MSEAKVLLVEDEPAIREMVAFSLGQVGFAVLEAGTVDEALLKLADESPDLILLDWMLPGRSGLELARRLRSEEHSRGIPILMLTARAEEDDKVVGLEAGADDYVTKPFSPRELVARIRALLRRSQPMAGEAVLKIGELVLDPSGHRVMVDGEPVDMGPTEFRLLQFFMTHPDRVFSRGQLLDRVWGRNRFVEERTVDVHILRLRQALSGGRCRHYVQTVRGMGYRFSGKTAS
jgi:two-component system phosphate regulon response regulator PhoB